jgi:hypothetical protein
MMSIIDKWRLLVIIIHGHRYSHIYRMRILDNEGLMIDQLLFLVSILWWFTPISTRIILKVLVVEFIIAIFELMTMNWAPRRTIHNSLIWDFTRIKFKDLVWRAHTIWIIVVWRIYLNFRWSTPSYQIIFKKFCDYRWMIISTIKI